MYPEALAYDETMRSSPFVFLPSLVIATTLVTGCTREASSAKGPATGKQQTGTPAESVAPPLPPPAVGRAAPALRDGSDPVTAIAAGNAHTCALRASGHVDCWGANGHGQLGAPSVGAAYDISATPVRVVGVDDAVAIGAGGSWSCAVRKTGKLACWGGGRLVETGVTKPLAAGLTSVETTALEQIPVVAVEGIDDAVAVAVGSPFSCATRKTSTVACFETTPVIRPPALKSVEVPSLDHVAGMTMESVGEYVQIACARRTDGTAVCFMDAEKPSKGGRRSLAFDSVYPIPGLSGVKRLALRSMPRSNMIRACAVVADGAVSCFGVIWPNTPHGRSGSALSYNTPEPARAKSIEDLALFDDRLCMRSTAGEIECAGLRSGPTTHMRELDGAKSIVAGAAHACALLADGRVGCWGDGRFGRVGRATTVGSDAVSPSVVAGVKGVTTLAPGPGFSCFVSPSGTACVGETSYAFDWEEKRRPRTWWTPQPIAVGRPREIEVTQTAGCALGDRFLCWGAYRLDKRVETPDDLGPAANLHGLADRGLGQCAIDAQGGARCWGHDVARGDGTTPTEQVPFPGVRVGNGVRAVEVAVGSYQVCLLESSPGPVSCWRSHLGDATLAEEPLRRASRVPGITDAVSVVIRRGSTCVRHKTGAVSCWETESTYEKPPPSPAPKAASELKDVVELKAGGQAICARRADGSVACWGMPEIARPATPWRDAKRPATIAMPPARAIFVGWTEACALMRDADEVRCWGSNRNGQLGDGSTPEAPGVVWLP